MAKNTHAQEAATGTSDSYTEHELTDPDIVVHREMLGGDPKLVGTDSSQSSGSDKKSGDNQNQDPQSPAQTTENLSPDTGKQAGSTVNTADGDTQKTERQRSGKAPARKSVRSRTIDDEFD